MNGLICHVLGEYNSSPDTIEMIGFYYGKKNYSLNKSGASSLKLLRQV